MCFQEIVEAALRKDEDLLAHALQSVSINVWKKGTCFFSPLSQLAMERNYEAVEFLINHGAGLNYAVMGAALAGHEDYTEIFLARGANINAAGRGAAMGGHREYAEALLIRGASINSVLRGAAMGGHVRFVEALLKSGANPRYAIQGIAMNENRDYVELLLMRGANINLAVRGAAFGGHTDYVETLLEAGASLNQALQGATLGGHDSLAAHLLAYGGNMLFAARGAVTSGHIKIAEAFLKNGVNIDDLVQGAACGAHTAYLEVLLKRKGCIYTATQAAVIGGQIDNDAKRQIAFLAFFQPATIPALVDAFTLGGSLLIEEATEKKAIAISRNLHQKKIPFSEALTRTDSDCQGMLYLLMLLMQKQSRMPKAMQAIPLELWEVIFNFITPAPLNRANLTHLGFITARTYLCAQLSVYESRNGSHKKSARRFFQAVSTVENREAMQTLVTSELLLQEAEDPGFSERLSSFMGMKRERKHSGRYHGILERWDAAP